MRAVGVLRDLALAVLVLAVLAAAGWTVLREPGSDVPDALEAVVAEAPSPSVAPPLALPSPALEVTASPAATVTAAVLRATSAPETHLVEAARVLGWQLVPADLGQPTPARQVVLVQASFEGLTRSLELLRSARATAPDSRIVVLAPLRSELGPDDLELLEEATAAARGEYLDPVALGWSTPDGTFSADGSLTPDGAARVGGLLAERLRAPGG